jgi:hypothetical protein
MYWKEFPTQIRAEDSSGEVNLQLPAIFMELADKAAMSRGLVGTDEYLEGWHWSDPMERPGSPQEVAKAVQEELEAQLRKAT